MTYSADKDDESSRAYRWTRQPPIVKESKFSVVGGEGVNTTLLLLEERRVMVIVEVGCLLLVIVVDDLVDVGFVATNPLP